MSADVSNVWAIDGILRRQRALHGTSDDAPPACEIPYTRKLLSLCRYSYEST